MSVGILHSIIIICYISILITEISIICKTPVRRDFSPVGIVYIKATVVEVTRKADTICEIVGVVRVRRLFPVGMIVDNVAAVVRNAARRENRPSVAGINRTRRKKIKIQEEYFLFLYLFHLC